jgi:hypothetical protein
LENLGLNDADDEMDLDAPAPAPALSSRYRATTITMSNFASGVLSSPVDATMQDLPPPRRHVSFDEDSSAHSSHADSESSTQSKRPLSRSPEDKKQHKRRRLDKTKADSQVPAFDYSKPPVNHRRRSWGESDVLTAGLRLPHLRTADDDAQMKTRGGGEKVDKGKRKA